MVEFREQQQAMWAQLSLSHGAAWQLESASFTLPNYAQQTNRLNEFALSLHQSVPGNLIWV